MATDEGTNERWRKFLVPGAASLVGAGAGLVLTRTNNLRDALPSFDNVGIGDVADDLRAKVSSVVGSGSNARSTTNARSTIDTRELEEHHRTRAERRKQRAGR